MTLRTELAATALPRDWAIANFVTNVEGSIEVQGSSRALSNEVDKASLLAVRDRVDVVLTSYKTAEAENYTRMNQRVLAIASRNSQILELHAYKEGTGLVLLLTTKANARQLSKTKLRSNTEIIGLRNYSPRGIRRALKIRGLRRIAVEGGVAFTDWFAGGRALNELALSITGLKKPFTSADSAKFLGKFKNCDFSLATVSQRSDTALTVWKVTSRSR